MFIRNAIIASLLGIFGYASTACANSCANVDVIGSFDESGLRESEFGIYTAVTFRIVSGSTLFDSTASELFEALPTSASRYCRGDGKRKWGSEPHPNADPFCTKYRVAANGPQGRFAPLTRWPRAILDRRSLLRVGEGRSGRRDGLFGRT